MTQPEPGAYGSVDPRGFRWAHPRSWAATHGLCGFQVHEDDSPCWLPRGHAGNHRTADPYGAGMLYEYSTAGLLIARNTDPDTGRFYYQDRGLVLICRDCRKPITRVQTGEIDSQARCGACMLRAKAEEQVAAAANREIPLPPGVVQISGPNSNYTPPEPMTPEVPPIGPEYHSDPAPTWAVQIGQRDFEARRQPEVKGEGNRRMEQAALHPEPQAGRTYYQLYEQRIQSEHEHEDWMVQINEVQTFDDGYGTTGVRRLELRILHWESGDFDSTEIPIDLPDATSLCHTLAQWIRSQVE